MVHLNEMEKISLIRLKKKDQNGSSLMKSKDLVGEVAEMLLGGIGAQCPIFVLDKMT